MSIQNLFFPNDNTLYALNYYATNLDSEDFGGNISLGAAKASRIDIGNVGNDVYINGVLYNPSTGSGYNVISPINAIDNNGIIINNGTAEINLEYADNTYPGIISISDQEFSGFKQFEKINAPNNNNTNSIFGLEAGDSITTAQYNVFIGFQSGRDCSTARLNTAIGEETLKLNDAWSNNAFGAACLRANISGQDNCGFGNNCLQTNTVSENSSFGNYSMNQSVTSTKCACFGTYAGFMLVNGSRNSFFGYNAGYGENVNDVIAIGYNAGSVYETNESNNIVIGNIGVLGDSSKIRIGTNGAHTATHIAGISGVSVGGSPLMAVVGTGDQLGTVPLILPSSGTLATLDGVETLTNKTLTAPIISTISNTGTLTLPTSTDTLVGKATTDILTNKTITGATNIVDANALKTSGASVNISSAGPPTTNQILIATSATTATWQSSISVTNATLSGNVAFSSATSTSTTGNITKNSNRFLHNFGTNCVFLGVNSGNFTHTATNSIGFGDNTLTAITSTANSNTALGSSCLQSLTTGTQNLVAGHSAGSNLLTGTNNVILGQGSGVSYTSSESNNLIIGTGVTGTVAESNIIRIGNGSHTKNFTRAIRGVTTDAADAIAVLVSSTGQLGTISSDRKLKENISYDLGDTKDIISKLKPCKFNYKGQESTKMTLGMIADEFKQVLPEYVVNLRAPKEKIIKSVKNENGIIEMIEEEQNVELEDTCETIQYQYLPIILVAESQRIQKDMNEMQKAMNEMQLVIDNLIKKIN